MIEPTGYCWKCGHLCQDGELFCNKKCEQIYYRNIERQTKQGKKAGYGVTGSCR